jgi:hypothetical protein
MILLRNQQGLDGGVPDDQGMDNDANVSSSTLTLILLEHFQH